MKTQTSQNDVAVITLCEAEVNHIHEVDQILYRLIDETDGTDSVEINDTAREAYYGIHNLLGIIEKYKKSTGENGAYAYDLPIKSVSIMKEDDC